METRPRRRGFVGPLLLVGAGVLLLLTNLGMIGWDAWQIIFRFWPIILIALGLEILIGRRSLVGSLVVLVIVMGIIGAVLTFVPAYQTTSAAQSVETVSQGLEGAKRASVDISFGAGTVRVGALSDSVQLIEGTVPLDPGEQLTKSFQVSGDTGTFRLGVRRVDSGPYMPTLTDRAPWDLRLNRDVPIALKVNGGVGTADLDLSQLMVTSLDANLGVGKSTITVPRTGQVQGSINGGVGEAIVVVPAGMAARIQADSGLGGLTVPEGYQKQNNVYQSPDYGTNQNRLDLRVKGGVGRIVVQQQP